MAVFVLDNLSNQARKETRGKNQLNMSAVCQMHNKSQKSFKLGRKASRLKIESQTVSNVK